MLSLFCAQIDKWAAENGGYSLSIGHFVLWLTHGDPSWTAGSILSWYSLKYRLPGQRTLWL